MRFAFPIIAMLLLTSATARAQQAPPFNGGGAGAAYDPEISVVSTGAITDVQVVVSDDLRYVTINARVSHSDLLSLNAFQVAQSRSLAQGSGSGPQGFVGNGGFLAASELSNQELRTANAFHGSPTSSSPTAILKVDPNAIHSMLRREGMFRLTINESESNQPRR